MAPRSSAPLLLTDFLTTPNRKIWLSIDIFVCYNLYILALSFNPYAKSEAFRMVSSQMYISAIFFAFCFGLVGVGLGIYDRSERFNTRALFFKIPLIWFISLIISVAVIYFGFYGKFGRLTYVLGSGAASLGVFFVRWVFAKTLKRAPYRFIVLGHTPTSMALQNAYSQKKDLSDLYEIFETSPQTPITVELLRRERIVDVIVSEDCLHDKEKIALCFSALQIGCRIIDEVDFYAQTFSKLPLHEIDENWILRQGFQNRRLMGDAVKRIFDIALGSLALILATPLLLIIYTLIWLEDRQNPLLVQERQGRYCRPFPMLKFRTMRKDVTSSTAGFTQQNDPRITRIGRIIRPLHLDELPQLLNIIRGHMSIVGPRPEMLHFAQKMSQKLPLYDLRYMFRPGLTGHAQLLTGYAMDNVAATEEKLAADLYYICKRTFLLDLGIMIRTAFKLTSGAR